MTPARQLRAPTRHLNASVLPREPDTLSPAQRAAAEAFADELVRIGKQQDDTRGLMFAAVADRLRAADQFFTARLMQWAADSYEGKR